MLGRFILFGFLYLAEGGPIGLVWWGMPVLLRAEGLSLARIGSLTAVSVLPWMFKFLWAPLVERWGRNPAELRRWILSCQLAMIALLLTLATLDPTENFRILPWLLIALSLMGATQDIAIDGLAIMVTPTTERGRLNSAMQLGLQVGRGLMTGLALLAAGWGGWQSAMTAATLFMSVSLVVAFIGLRGMSRSTDSTRTIVSLATILAWARDLPLMKVAFYALTAAAGFEATGVLAGPILHDAGVPEDRIGLYYSVGISALLALGGVSAGRLVDTVGVRHALRATTLGFVTPILVLAALWYGANPSLPVLAGCLGSMYFFVGCYTVASYAAFMGVARVHHAPATLFTLFMACTNGCEAWTGWLVGHLADDWGYAAAISILATVSLASLAWLPSWREDLT